jgi:hypothetical protein
MFVFSANIYTTQNSETFVFFRSFQFPCKRDGNLFTFHPGVIVQHQYWWGIKKNTLKKMIFFNAKCSIYFHLLIITFTFHFQVRRHWNCNGVCDECPTAKTLSLSSACWLPSDEMCQKSLTMLSLSIGIQK